MENHELIYNEIKERLLSQDHTLEQMNLKAGTLMGFMGLFLSVIYKTVSTNEMSVLIMVSLILLLFAIYLSFIVFIAQKYRADPKPRTLFENYWNKPLSKTRKVLISNFIETYEANKHKIEKRLKKLNDSLKLFFVSLTLFILDLFIIVTIK